MRSLQIASHLSDAELTACLKQSHGSQDCSRWQLLYLIQIAGLRSAAVLSPLVNLSVHSIYMIVARYNKQGPTSVSQKPKGGRRRSLLSLEEEQALVAFFEQSAGKAALKTTNDMRILVEGRVGRVVSDDYFWDLLHRHGWKKKEPRSHHPKRSVEQPQEFNKNSPKCWQPLP